MAGPPIIPSADPGDAGDAQIRNFYPDGSWWFFGGGFYPEAPADRQFLSGFGSGRFECSM